MLHLATRVRQPLSYHQPGLSWGWGHIPQNGFYYCVSLGSSRVGFKEETRQKRLGAIFNSSIGGAVWGRGFSSRAGGAVFGGGVHFRIHFQIRPGCPHFVFPVCLPPVSGCFCASGGKSTEFVLVCVRLRVIGFLICFFLSCSLRPTSPLLLLLLNSSVGAPH